MVLGTVLSTCSGVLLEIASRAFLLRTVPFPYPFPTGRGIWYSRSVRRVFSILYSVFGMVVGMVLVMGIGASQVKAVDCNSSHVNYKRCGSNNNGDPTVEKCICEQDYPGAPCNYIWSQVEVCSYACAQSGNYAWCTSQPCGHLNEICCSGNDPCNDGLYCNNNNRCNWDDDCSSGQTRDRQRCGGDPAQAYTQISTCDTSSHPYQWGDWVTDPDSVETCPLGCDGNQL